MKNLYLAIRDFFHGGFSPYCKKCDSCGEEGCCSPLRCFANWKRPSGCKYGETYRKDLILAYLMYDELSRIIDDSGDEKLQRLAKEKFDKIFDEVYK